MHAERLKLAEQDKRRAFRKDVFAGAKREVSQSRPSDKGLKALAFGCNTGPQSGQPMIQPAAAQFASSCAQLALLGSRLKVAHACTVIAKAHVQQNYAENYVEHGHENCTTNPMMTRYTLPLLGKQAACCTEDITSMQKQTEHREDDCTKVLTIAGALTRKPRGRSV